VNYFTLIFGCHNPEVTFQSSQIEQSIPEDDQKSIVLGAPETPVQNVINLEQISVHLPEFSELISEQQMQVTAMLNLATPPCEACFEQFTYAECIVNDLECPVIQYQLSAVYQRVTKGQGYEEALEVLRFQDLWFENLQDPTRPLTMIIAAESSDSVEDYLNEIIPNFDNEETSIIFYDVQMKTLKKYGSKKTKTSLSFNFESLDNFSEIGEDWERTTLSKLNEIHHRSNPTIYLNGYRARGMQSIINLNHLSARGLEIIEDTKSSWEN
jgi:hypothetical protein